MIDLARLRDERPSASGRTPVLVPGGVAWSVPEAALVEATDAIGCEGGSPGPGPRRRSCRPRPRPAWPGRPWG